MRFSARFQPAVAGLVAVVLVAGCVCRAQGQTTEELQRELKEMKADLERLQQRMKKQEELINQLEAQKAGAAPAAPPTPQASAEEEQRRERALTEKIMRRIQPSLAAANKTFPSQFNPAIGLGIDNVYSQTDNQGANFDFRSAELGVSASVDPFVRGYAFFNGTNDGVDVEEAAIVTTSLPYNMTVKGGRFFADFGRLSKFHDHDLPFVNRPLVLDSLVGGESQADGLELNYLAPTAQYLTLTLGGYNKIGADNTRVDNAVPRPNSELTYLGRPATFFNIGDANSIDVGGTFAYTPRVDSYMDGATEVIRNGKPRYLSGLDLTYRYTPLSEASYHGLTWGTEVLYNRENWDVSDTGTPQFEWRNAWGMYSYVEAKLTRRFSPGFLFDFTQAIDRSGGPARGYSPYLTIWPSEFQRLRLQYTYLDEPANHENELFAQWTVFLGSHVHGFRNR